jgi:hypothetical protein
MPVVVDLPLVPPTAMLCGAALKSWASNSRAPHHGHAEPPRRLHVRHRLFDGGDVTRICSARVTPLPSWA